MYVFVYPQQKPEEIHYTPTVYSFYSVGNSLRWGKDHFPFTSYTPVIILFFSMYTVLLDKCVYKHMPRLYRTHKTLSGEPQRHKSASQPRQFLPPCPIVMGIRQHPKTFTVVTTGGRRGYWHISSRD